MIEEQGRHHRSTIWSIRAREPHSTQGRPYWSTHSIRTTSPMCCGRSIHTPCRWRKRPREGTVESLAPRTVRALAVVFGVDRARLRAHSVSESP